MGKFEKSDAESKLIMENFDKLRHKVRKMGLLDGNTTFFVLKFLQCIGIILFALILQSKGIYIPSALLMGLAWQQLGWMIHEYCHHQHFKNHFANDVVSYIVGNLLQGFSSGGWKDQHNVHHAATNGIDLVPFY